MRIDFFEEYPSAETLEPAAQLPAPATVYLAATGLDAYLEHAALLCEVDERHTPAWWAILPRSYWVSPFASSEELDRLGEELASSDPLTLLLDTELPLVRPGRFLLGARGFRRGRARVRNLFAIACAHGHRLATAEYPALGARTARVLRWLGISQSFDLPHTRIPMVYSSLVPSRALLRRMREHVVSLARRHPGQVGVGLGTLASGVFGNEPKLEPRALEDDLRFFSAAGLRSATLFRLGGLDDAYLDVLRAVAPY